LGSVVSITVGSTNQPSESSQPPPTSTVALLPDAFASSIAAFCVRKELPSMTAPMKLPKSETSPTFRPPTSRTSWSRTSGHRFDGMKRRDAAEHF